MLKSTRGRGTRPLRGQVREALFDILGDRVEGGQVWDLFAGTGCTGIEAMSRGADSVVFVEKNNQALSVLKENVELVGIDDRAEVLKGDAWEATTLLSGRPSVIFLDPPYQNVAEDPVRSAYRASQMVEHLAPGGVLCFHFEEGVLDEDDFDHDFAVDFRRWGRSAVALIEMSESGRESDQQADTPEPQGDPVS